MSELAPITDPVLYRVADPITKFDADTVQLFSRMMKTLIGMDHGSRLGMAFPQIGVSLRGVIVLGTPMANPEWTPAKGQVVFTEEGCYSLTRGEIHKRIRAKYGWARWQNPMSGEWVEKKINGLEAIVFQHELNHIDGILCNDPRADGGN